MTDEPPALTLESDASKILLRLWHGERFVFHAPPSGSPRASTEAYVEVATIVAAHLHLRAGFRVHIVGDTKDQQIAVHRSLRSALPTTAIGLPYGVTTNDIPIEERVAVPVSGGLRQFEITTPWTEDPSFGLIDLVVVFAGERLRRDNLIRYLNGARQLLVLGYNRYASGLDLRDRDDLEPPVDVIIAGGAFG